MRWRKTLRFRWRKILEALFLLGLSTSLFISFWPPNQIRGVAPLPRPQKRRIQEAAPRGAAVRIGAPAITAHASNASENEVRTPSRLSLRSKGRRVYEEKVIFVNNYTLPFLEIPKIVAQKHQNKSMIQDEQTAQLAAMALKEQDILFTEQQKELLDKTDLKTALGIKSTLTRIRKQREEFYFTQLRKKSQIQQLPSGGERVIASPISPVQFPRSLQKVKPEQWTGSYRTYLNMTFFPWPNAPSCKEFSTTFAPPGSLKLMALASFPSSGNSWVRYLLESGSGIFTGSMYDDSSLTRKGLYGEGIIFDSGMTIVQKTHGYTTGGYMKLPHEERVQKNHMEDVNNQGVIIIRNPFKALISHRHLDAGGHTGYAPRSHFVGKGWKDFILIKINLWKEFYMDWLDAARPEDLYVVFYEDLKSDPLAVLRGILKFLHLPVDNRRLDCLSKHHEGMFKRKPSKMLTLTTDPFTEDLKDVIYRAIDDLNEALLQKGKKILPIHNYEMYNATEAALARKRRHES